ncbi:hypothetical protein ACFLZ7_00830 [Nanoarchaeota archaeon]
MNPINKSLTVLLYREDTQEMCEMNLSVGREDASEYLRENLIRATALGIDSITYSIVENNAYNRAVQQRTGDVEKIRAICEEKGIKQHESPMLAVYGSWDKPINQPVTEGGIQDGDLAACVEKASKEGKKEGNFMLMHIDDKQVTLGNKSFAYTRDIYPKREVKSNSYSPQM